MRAFQIIHHLRNIKKKFISWFKRLVYMHNNIFYRLCEMSKVEKVEEIIFINSLFKGF